MRWGGAIAEVKLTDWQAALETLLAQLKERLAAMPPDSPLVRALQIEREFLAEAVKIVPDRQLFEARENLEDDYAALTSKDSPLVVVNFDLKFEIVDEEIARRDATKAYRIFQRTRPKRLHPYERED